MLEEIKNRGEGMAFIKILPRWLGEDVAKFCTKLSGDSRWYSRINYILQLLQRKK